MNIFILLLLGACGVHEYKYTHVEFFHEQTSAVVAYRMAQRRCTEKDPKLFKIVYAPSPKRDEFVCGMFVCPSAFRVTEITTYPTKSYKIEETARKIK